MNLGSDNIYKIWKTYNAKYTIIMRKEGKYLTLDKPSDEGKSFRYDLSTGEFERINYYKTRDIKYTPVKVSNITRWFTNCELYTDDGQFARLVIFLSKFGRLRKYKSAVRFIEQLDDKNGRAFEEWDRIGIRFDDIEKFFKDYKEGYYDNPYKYHYLNFNYRPSDFDKEKLNYIKKLGRLPSIKELHRIYQTDFEDEKILYKLKEINKKPQYLDVFDVRRNYYASSGDTINVLENNYKQYIRDSMIGTIKRYNLNIEAFVDFVNRIKRTEAVTLDDLFNARHYTDYLRMEYELKDRHMLNMVKYPKHFLSTFHLTKSEYNAKKEVIDDKRFKEECDKHRELEYGDRKYQIVVPVHKSEIEVEADELKHCVRSYIRSVVEGNTLIVFCRDVKDIEKPLVTIEVRKGNVTQAYGEHDHKPSDEILEFIRKWSRIKKLKLSWCWD